MPKLTIVAKREYLKTIRSRTFWLATLAMPVLVGVLSFISGSTATSVESRFEELAEQTSDVAIVDDSGLINTAILPKTYTILSNKEDAAELVRQGEHSALIFYPQDVLESKRIELYQQSQGVFGENIFNQLATRLLTQSIQLELEDPVKVQILNSPLQVDTIIYKDGEIVSSELQKLIVPGISVVIYFIMVFLSANFMLMSVSEEKENRMVETIITAIEPKQLIIGKILGYIAVALTQIAVFAVLGIAALTFANLTLPFSLNELNIQPGQIIGAIFYTLMGFLILASTMVGVGSAMPNYRDAQSFSSVFIILSILPVYFVTVLIAEPSGTAALITSYFPFTAPIILLFRNALGELGLGEVILSGSLLLAYAAIAIWLAFKLFEFGSLEYAQRISLQRFIDSFRSSKQSLPK